MGHGLKAAVDALCHSVFSRNNRAVRFPVHKWYVSSVFHYISWELVGWGVAYLFYYATVFYF